MTDYPAIAQGALDKIALEPISPEPILCAAVRAAQWNGIFAENGRRKEPGRIPPETARNHLDKHGSR
jgi:hypothetical protein